MDLQDLLSKSLIAHDNKRDRSKQVEIGPSSVGGCRRQVYHKIIGTPVTNPNTDSLAAILGTFIHAGIAEAIVREDPFKDNFLIEQEVTFGNLKGHVDLFIKDAGIVVDWKTTKVKSLRYFPSDQQRMQVQLYGYLLSKNDYDVKKVALVAIPRDGEMRDIKVHIEDFDIDIAQAGLDWLDELDFVVENKLEAPAPEKPIQFCANYCDFYDATGAVGCPSMRR